MTYLRISVFAHLQRLSVGWFERRQLGDILSRLTGDIARDRRADAHRRQHDADLLVPAPVLRRHDVPPQLAAHARLVHRGARLPPAFSCLLPADPERVPDLRGAPGRSPRSPRRTSGTSRSCRPTTAPTTRSRGSPGEPGRLPGADARHPPRGAVRPVHQPRRVRRRAHRHRCRRLRARSRAITLGGLLAFLAYLSQLYGPVQGFAGLSNTLFAASAGAERIIELPDEEPAVAEPDAPAARPRHRRAPVRGGLVHLRRHRATRPARGGLRLARPQVAIVGASGAGKSTLTKLLLRTYDPDRGRRDPRRRRPARLSLSDPAPQHQRGAAGDARLRRHGRREHPVGQAGRHRRGGARRGARPPTRTGSSRGSTSGYDTGSASGAPALRRPAAAPRHRPGDDPRRPRPPARRADDRPGRRVGPPCAGSAAPAHGRPYHDHHLARPAHRDRRRRDRRPRRRARSAPSARTSSCWPPRRPTPTSTRSTTRRRGPLHRHGRESLHSRR